MWWTGTPKTWAVLCRGCTSNPLPHLTGGWLLKEQVWPPSWRPPMGSCSWLTPLWGASRWYQAEPIQYRHMARQHTLLVWLELDLIDLLLLEGVRLNPASIGSWLGSCSIITCTPKFTTFITTDFHGTHCEHNNFETYWSDSLALPSGEISSN